MTHDGAQDDALRPELLAIGKVFDGRSRYLVPIYQRNYAWQAEQIEQMLDDLWDAKGNYYFLGNLIVTRSQASSAFPVYEVIDGQQRLTTLYLLLRGLEHHGHTGCLQYESRPRAMAALDHIAQAPSDLAAGEPPAEDHAIWQGHRIIKQYLARHLKSQNEQKLYRDFVLAHTQVVRITLPAKIDVNRYFEIMNTRGQQLQQVDIVKARLMAHLGNEVERACFAWIWDACAQMDAYVQMTLSRGNTELRSQIFGKDWSFLCLKDFDDLLECHQNIHSGQTHSEPTSSRPSHGYGALEIDAAIEAYAKPTGAKEAQDENAARFQSIIDFPFFLLHVLKLIMQEGASENEGILDDKRLVKRFDEFLEVKGRDKREGARQLVFHLLRYRNLFDNYVIKREFIGATDDDGDWSLRMLKKDKDSFQYVNTYPATENNAPDTASLRLLRLQSMLRVTYTSPRTMHWITLLLGVVGVEQQGEQTVEEDVLLSQLQDYAREMVKKALFKDKEPSGFGIERIVFTYLDYLLLEPASLACFPEEMGAKAKFRNYKFSFRDSIEHFYPQNPRAGMSCNAIVSENCLDCLGNLALLSVSDNSRFSNDCPKHKADHEKIIDQSPKLALMAHVAKHGVWDDEAILAHHNAMISLLEKDLRLYQAGGS
ncbi:hypothetical protein BAE29_05955 [Acidithiobacillus caldus]|nr:DUF262 domain-containing protein [Acidithiobacillus caldus]OFC38887.1 hypothetical protein BAE28_04720 [Acidithiobacillus caldus]OFC40054.1 hypothetical protein BAE29_05955 [Acidithiobacillus caldus]